MSRNKIILAVTFAALLGVNPPARAGITDMLSRIIDVLSRLEQALPFALSSRYGAIWTQWLDIPAAQQPVNEIWQQALSGKADFQEALRQTSVALQPIPDLSSLATDVRGDLQGRIAQVERNDLINADTIHNRGAISLHSAQNDRKISTLELDVESTNPATKHLLAQLQLANIAHVQSLHISQDTNKLLAVLAQLLLVRGQAERDGQAAAVNRQLDYVGYMQPLQKRLSTGINESVARFRLP